MGLGEDRYGLRIEIAGKPVSANRAWKHPILPNGRRLTVLTKEAAEWNDAIERAVILAVRDRPPMLPHPRDWPRPLHILIAVLSRHDSDNPIKLALDAVKRAIEVDDRYYDHTAIHRAARAGREGLILHVMSAPRSSRRDEMEELLEGAELWMPRPKAPGKTKTRRPLPTG